MENYNTQTIDRTMRKKQQVETFAVVRHDGVTERQHPEEEVGLRIPLLHLQQQAVVVELEGRLEKPVL